MRLTVPCFLLLAIFLVAGVNAQQQPAESIQDLLAAIKKLEAIDAASTTPADIKEINRQFLIERRATLLTLLKERERSRREYLNTAMSALSTAQILKLEQEISSLTEQIKGLEQQLMLDEKQKTGGAANSETGEPATKSGIVSNGSDTATASGVANNSSSINSESEVVTSGAPQSGSSTPQPATGATSVSRQYQLRLGGTAASVRNAKLTNPRATIDIRNSFFLFALALVEPKVAETQPAVIADFTAKAEDIKTDKQPGANTGTGGSTSLVTKAGIPAVFGFAVENGALTRTDNNTIVTFSGTPVGIIEALTKRGFIEGYQNDDHFDRFLRKFSFKLNFDTSRGETPGTFTGRKQQLAGYSIRYNLIDQRDPRDKKYTDRWAALVETEGVRVVSTLGGFFRQIFNTPTAAFTEWRIETESAVADAAPADVEAVLSRQLEKLRTIDLGAPVSELMTSFGNQFDSLLRSRDDILNEVNAGWISTIEYNNERRPALPSISNLTFIAEKGAYNGSIDLTANASVSFLNSLPQGSNMKRLRDYSFSGQLDVPMGNVVRTGKFVLSFAGRFERLENDEQADGVMTAAKGNIGVGQVKLTIPVRGTAFKIPISVTFANRTELIKEKHVRGSFGLTFDLDSLLAKFNPFSQ